LVCKPRHGAGSQATFLVPDSGELSRYVAAARDEGWRGELMLQSFVSGTAASVAFLVGPEQTLALAPASQSLSNDGRYRYCGGTIPLPPDLAERGIGIARRAVDSVSDLRGYVGVDVVLGETEWVIEINPRLTTSYLGLRALAETNLAEMMVHVVRGEEIVPPRWRTDAVRFLADGTLI
jgi:predicted ATP-grasp superfamily ATP-dependent carboligase